MNKDCPLRVWWKWILNFMPHYADYENNNRFDKVQLVMKGSPWFPILIAMLYLMFCYYGQIVMTNYKPFNLKYTLASWNLFLSLFSTWGFIRTAPHLYYLVTNYSLEYTVCDDARNEWGVGATGLAVMFFILSKFPELLDTVFVVLKKKPVIFLHWYHHITVLLYCWNSYVTESATGLYFVVMNYFVHSLMYFYYFAMTVKIVPRWFPSWIITALQISQMFVGMFIVGSAIYFYIYGGDQWKPGECNNKMSNMIAGAVIYSSYAILFLAFALSRYITKPSSLKKNSKPLNKMK